MGRVRRYKKHKNIDLGARSGGGKKDAQQMDEPPELFEQRERAREKRRAKWDGSDEDRELLMRREAMRAMRLENSTATKNKSVETNIAPKQQNETLKQFHQRVRQETRKTLVEELQKRTSTAQKRKARLKERSLARKAKKKGGAGAYKEEKIEFFTAADGRIRPSDRGDVPTAFKRNDDIGFGERVDRPPELHQFAAKLRRKSKDTSIAGAKINALRATGGCSDDSAAMGSGSSNAGGVGDVDDGDDDDDYDDSDDLGHTAKKKRKRGQHIMHRADMDGDDNICRTGDRGFEEQISKARVKSGTLNDTQMKSAKSKLGSGGVSGRDNTATGSGASKVESTNAHNEMEALRARVLEAYKSVKEKRRAAASAATNSSNKLR